MNRKPMWLTDTNNTLRTWVPSIPFPVPASYLHRVGESIYISYVPSFLVWHCRFGLSNKLDVKVTSIALRPGTQLVSTWWLLTWMRPGGRMLTVWISSRSTFIADGTETSFVMYVSTAFTTSMFVVNAVLLVVPCLPPFRRDTACLLPLFDYQLLSPKSHNCVKGFLHR